jgi:hypothetical protein
VNKVSPTRYTRLVVGVTCRVSRTAGEIRPFLRDEATAALKNVDIPGAFARIAFPIPGRGAGEPATAYDEVLEQGLMNGVHLGGLDAVLDVAVPVDGDRGRVVDALAGFGERHADVVDADACIAAVGTDFVILDGTAAIQLFYFMRRNPALTLTEFSDTWRDQHTKVAQFTPGLSGYRQLHLDAELSAAAGAHAGVGTVDFDGVALEWFDGVDAFISATSAPPEFLEQAKASEARFNDLGRVTAVLTTVDDVIRVDRA